jgi:hypothetical protein
MVKTYALIKDSIVLNTVIVEEDNLDAFKEAHENPEMIEIASDTFVEINYVYDGENFINPNPIAPLEIPEREHPIVVTEDKDKDGISKPN